MSRPIANSQEPPASGKPSICFVALNAYGLLSGRQDIQHIGGAEVQQTLIARELVKRGYRVSFVVLDHGQPDGEQIGGIRLFKAYRSGAGSRVARFFHPRLTGLWSAMRRADADICYQRGAGSETGLVAMWCRCHRRRFIFAVAHDAQCDRQLRYLRTRHERLLYHYGLQHADAVVTQTRTQQEMLRSEFGRDSLLIRSCAPHVVDGAPIPPGETARPHLIWLGRFAPEKGQEHLVDMAHLCPEYHFDVLGDANADTQYGRDFRRRAGQIENMFLHGWVPHADVGRHYQRASALLCTSVAEGFPNTFLEAWSRGLPVVTRVDVDELVVHHRLGVFCRDTAELAQQLREFFASSGRWEACSRRARAYVAENHAIGPTVDKYEWLLTQVLGATRADGHA